MKFIFITSVFFILMISLVFCQKTSREATNAAIEKNQQALDNIKKIENSVDEISKYTDCVVAATNEAALKECEKMKENFSPKTIELMERAKKNN